MSIFAKIEETRRQIERAQTEQAQRAQLLQEEEQLQYRSCAATPPVARSLSRELKQVQQIADAAYVDLEEGRLQDAEEGVVRAMAMLQNKE